MPPVCLLLLLGQTPTATTAADSNAVETIVVTGSRISERTGPVPYATTTLTESEILAGRPTLTLGEALSQVPGVFVTSRFNFAQDSRLSIRGFGARSAFGIRGIRILLDGIPLTLPDGQSQIDSIDMASIGRIGVLRGPAASLYGNAAGGVLVLSSRAPTEQTSVEVNQVVGTYDLVKTAITGRTQLDDLGFSFFASRTRFGGPRANSTSEQFVTMARVEAELSSRILWTSQLHYVRGPQAQDAGGLTEAEVDDDPTQAAPNNLRFRTGEDLSQIQFGSRLVAQLDEHHRLEFVGHAGIRSFEGRIPFRVVEFDRNFYGGQVLYRYRVAPLEDLTSRLSVGIEIQGQEDRRRNEGNADGVPSGEVLLNQEERALSFGTFTQEKLTLFGWLTVLGSVRYDRINFDVEDRKNDDGDASGARSFDQVTGQGGLLVQLTRHIDAFANVSQSFETPTFSELVNSGPDGGLSAELDAQLALSLEAGARARGETFEVEASVFYIDLDNELIAREDDENRVFFTNAGSSDRLGAEVFGRWQVIDSLEIRASYSLLLAQFVDDAKPDVDGSRIPGLPVHRLFARIRWSQGGFHAAAEVEYVGDRVADNADTVRADAYALGEIRAGARFDIGLGLWGDLTFGVRNLFDVEYVDNVRINAFGGRYFEPGPPLHVYGALSVGWAQP